MAGGNRPQSLLGLNFEADLKVTATCFRLKSLLPGVSVSPQSSPFIPPRVAVIVSGKASVFVG